LSAILQALTRYSANDPQFPVNDRSLFTGAPAAGKSHARTAKPGKAHTAARDTKSRLAR